MRNIVYLLATVTHALLISAQQSAQTCVLIVPDPPPSSSQTGLKLIPDAAHPFVAPGATDQRGPCPGLNTLANHGYLPRNGIATFQQLVNATGEGFNMEYTLASALAGFAMLARGNACINRVSIGLPSPQVPPLPGNIDGTQAGGLATHGRFEGDVSMTRSDFHIGDNIHFNQTLYHQLLGFVAEFGDNSPVTGPNSIVNVKVMQEFKFQRFLDDQLANIDLEYFVGRFLLSYGESAFTLNFFANGTDGTLSVPTMTSFFQFQTFPANWHRRSSPGDGGLIGSVANTILSAHPISPGSNNANGVYVNETFTGGMNCAAYDNLAGDNLAAVLLSTTGILNQNVNNLINIIHNEFSGCAKVLPSGPAGV